MVLEKKTEMSKSESSGLIVWNTVLDSILSALQDMYMPLLVASAGKKV